MTTLNVGIPGTWGELIPSLQHTAYADGMLTNQYDSLIEIGEGGVVLPVAAKKWKIEDNYRTFIFTINTELKFSNGKSLTAHDFKSAWEHSLSLAPKSSNNSLQDNLYKVEGFEEFAKNKHITGLIAKDDETFIVKFKEPFRMGLENLTGSRMSAFIIENGEYLGTGPFVFVERGEKHALLKRNPYSKLKSKFSTIKYEYIPSEQAVSALKENKIQLFVFADRAEIADCMTQNTNISCYLGNEAEHSVLVVNGLKNRFFSNQKYRKAFQALIHKKLKQNDLPIEFQSTLRLDPQIYMPLQKGRLKDEEVNNIINDGEKHIKDMIAATEKTPLMIQASKDMAWVIDFIKSLGLKLSEKSKIVNGKTKVNTYYKSFEPDILPAGLSVISSDPDGIYHAYGKNGAIASPMAYRKSLADLLEKGREVMKEEKVHSAYKLVSKSALEEVPAIHLGFVKTRTAYRNDLIRVKNEVKERENDSLIHFEPIN